MLPSNANVPEPVLHALTNSVAGDIHVGDALVKEYSRDWSLFAVEPQLVVEPKTVEDIKTVVTTVAKYKAEFPALSITGRSAGTDMTGGPLNESIILGCTKYLNYFSVDAAALRATLQPGVFYRDFEAEAGPLALSMPSYPASKSLSAVGGITMNNSGGERTLRYGQTRDFVDQVKMVLADGNEYTFGPLTRNELAAKRALSTFEGQVYRDIADLIDEHWDVIQAAAPTVSKNSSGYALWRVYDAESGTFDLAQLFVGSQGTLGILTEVTWRLVVDKPHRRTIPIFFKDWSDMPDVVNQLREHDLETLEAFDDETLLLGIRFMPQIAKLVGENILLFAWRFWPEAMIGIRMLGVPKLIILAEVAEETPAAADAKAADVVAALASHRVWLRPPLDEQAAEKYWLMRRNSFKILTEQTKGKRSAPFVEDFCIDPDLVPEFLPKAFALLKRHGIKANIAGHAGNGNFHIIPLMDLRQESEQTKILPVADEFYALVAEYHGSISAEHNDGILRTPYLEGMFGAKMTALFAAVKHIFDPQNIFNPGKKVAGSRDARAYLRDHIAGSNR